MQLGMTQYNTTVQSVAASKPKGEGFFQVNLDRLTEIVRSGLRSDCLFAQVVLAGGVNGHLAEARASTHGANSVNDRTFMGKPAADRAIDMLSRGGFLEPAPDPTHKSHARWYVDRHCTPDVAISQKFLEKQEKTSREKWVRGRGRLSDLYCGTRAAPGFPIDYARSDALLMYFQLHKHQDFGRFGGVSPACAEVRFTPASTIDGDGIDHVLEAAHEGWSLVTENEPRCQPDLSAKFLETALPEVPSWDDAPSVADRGVHALKELQRVGLIYSAAVVWQADPVLDLSGRMEPLYTLYVKGAWTDELETSLQYAINNAVIQSGTRSGVDVYGASRGTTADYHGRGRHSYFLPDEYLKKAVLLKQLRVRWWPHNEDTIVGLNRDRQRNDDWADDIASDMDCTPPRARNFVSTFGSRPNP